MSDLNLIDGVTSLKDKASDIAASMGQKASDVASNLGDKASGIASSVGQKASDIASSVGDRADGTLALVGEKISGAGAALWESTPADGILAAPVSAVAAQLESGGEYLATHSTSDLAADLKLVLTKYPLQSLSAGLAVGILLGLAISSRR